MADIVSRPATPRYRQGWENIWGTPNKARYFCEQCDQQITAPGVGHSPECAGLKENREVLRFIPEPYIIDTNGDYYANMQSGHRVIRRLARD